MEHHDVNRVVPKESRSYCFTMFNMDEMKSWPIQGCTYLIYQKELCPRTSKEHFQGFIQFRLAKSLGGCKKLFPSAHFEVPYKPVSANIAYCSKTDTYLEGPWEYGTISIKGSNKRKLAEACERSPERMKLEESTVYRRWYSQESQRRFYDTFNFDFPLKKWQEELEDLLDKEPNGRDIIWVYGEKGNEGKSTYAKKLKKDGWFYTSGGKTENVLYRYGIDVDRNVVFDIPRSAEEYINYGLIETIKNGEIESTKYEPLVFSRTGGKEIHIVIMANFLPIIGSVSDYNDRGVLLKAKHGFSEDRIKIIDCKPFSIW